MGTTSDRVRRAASSVRGFRERHAERHRPSGFHFAFADRIDALDARRWDAVVDGSSVFLRRDVLRALEDHGPDNVVPRYALVLRERQPVAAFLAQIVTVTGERLHRKPEVASENPAKSVLRRALSPVARVAASGIRQRMLVAGNLMSCGFHGIAFARGVDPVEAWPGVLDALYKIRRAERLTGQANVVMVKDLTEREGALDALRRFSYRPLVTDPDMVLAVDPAWSSYEDYLGALAPKYRRNCKDQAKKLAAAGCTVESLANPSAQSGRLHELYLAVHGNAPVRLVTLAETYFPALAEALGDRFRCNVVVRDGELLGFVTTIRDGKTAIAYYIGFDRSAAASGLPIYLRLLHSTIQDAIEWKCERLSLGRTALVPKAALGAKPEPMSVWLRHRLPHVNWLVRGVVGVVPHDEPPERNPFKAGADGDG